MVKTPSNWTNLVEVIQYADALAKETGCHQTVYCINGRSHYAICESGKLPPDSRRIGKLIIHKDHQRRYSVVYNTRRK